MRQFEQVLSSRLPVKSRIANWIFGTLLGISKSDIAARQRRAELNKEQMARIPRPNISYMAATHSIADTPVHPWGRR